MLMELQVVSDLGACERWELTWSFSRDRSPSAADLTWSFSRDRSPSAADGYIILWDSGAAKEKRKSPWGWGGREDVTKAKRSQSHHFRQ